MSPQETGEMTHLPANIKRRRFCPQQAEGDGNSEEKRVKYRDLAAERWAETCSSGLKPRTLLLHGHHLKPIFILRLIVNL